MFLGTSILFVAPQNRNKLGGNLQLMLEFNDVIGKLGVQEVSLKG